ncbi:MAG TPA: BadF/BadG/BcrA/BcrD ATPase family protein [Gemmatimonadaceae bacterium]|nr:BadF/BadG/BcrA/BcrD ATPase family protein [Gemmatimonadaceae bacterium]
MSETIVVGIECNGSTASAMVIGRDGDIVGRASGPGPRMSLEGVAQTVEAIVRVTREALASGGVTVETPAVLCAGVAGAGRDQERFVLWRELNKQELAEEVIVQPDATVALHDAFGREPGILVIGGAGAIAYGQTPDGDPVRCGGWGPLAGDEGGATWIGRRALGLVTAMADGREPRGPLLDAVLAAIGANKPADIISWVAGASPSKLATLAPAVLESARAGDAYASALVREAAAELVRLVVGLRPLVAPAAAPAVAVVGELLAPGTLVRAAFEETLAVRAPDATFRADEVVPVRGAADLALLYLSDRAAAKRLGQVAPLAKA